MRERKNLGKEDQNVYIEEHEEDESDLEDED